MTAEPTDWIAVQEAQQQWITNNVPAGDYEWALRGAWFWSEVLAGLHDRGYDVPDTR